MRQGSEIDVSICWARNKKNLHKGRFGGWNCCTNFAIPIIPVGVVGRENGARFSATLTSFAVKADYFGGCMTVVARASSFGVGSRTRNFAFGSPVPPSTGLRVRFKDCERSGRRKADGRQDRIRRLTSFDKIGDSGSCRAGCHAQAQLERALCVRRSTVKRSVRFAQDMVWPCHPETTEVVRQNS